MLNQLVLALGAALSVSAVAVPNFGAPAIDNGAALTALNAIARDNAYSRMSGTCNRQNVKVRKEWRKLTKPQRKNYIAAVKCIQQTPPSYPGIPAVPSQWEDFVWLHLIQTGQRHLTATFLIWHRLLIHTFEQKLHACGYTGALPYWEWGLDVDTPLRNTPIFDGSDTSLGSDGEFLNLPPWRMSVPNSPNLSIITDLPPGTGGGCIFAGPFANMTLHVGNILLPVPGTDNFTGVVDPTVDTPRCLRRNLNNGILKRFSSFRNTTRLILDQADIGGFQGHMQGDGRYVDLQMGVHGGGHYSFGMDPGGDPFTSPGDPAFYLHHAQIDRVYWIWQNLDFQNRQGVFGDDFMFPIDPPPPPPTVNSTVDVGPLGPAAIIKDLMDTVTGSPLCYVYQ